MIGVNIAQAYSTGTRMYDEDAQLKTEMTKIKHIWTLKTHYATIGK